MAAYYNEIDPYAAQWLRNLIAAGHIAPGDVDERSIVDVKPDDLRGYAQCHFFAGIGGWSLALRMAGWPDDRPVWTGSCPCQPHSSAAADKRRKFNDPRDLWPVFFDLACRDAACPVFGEQVDDNPEWIDRMLSDMEGANLAVAALDIPACAVDAPHQRMRTVYVAYPDSSGLGEQSGAITMAPEQLSIKCSGSSPFFGHQYTAGESGKLRRIKPGICLLAHGIPARVGRLRAYGNAVVPQVAAEFIKAAGEAIGC